MPSFSLIAITGHSSYPLTSENASPFGTCTVYLSCAEIATPAAKTAIDTEILRLISVLFFIVASPSFGLAADNPSGNRLVALPSPRLRTAPTVGHEEHDYSMDLRVAKWGPMPAVHGREWVKLRRTQCEHNVFRFALELGH